VVHSCDYGIKPLGSIKQWNFVTEEILASQEGLCCVEFGSLCCLTVLKYKLSVKHKRMV
jgi:hypothetical protein